MEPVSLKIAAGGVVAAPVSGWPDHHDHLVDGVALSYISACCLQPGRSIRSHGDEWTAQLACQHTQRNRQRLRHPFPASLSRVSAHKEVTDGTPNHRSVATYYSAWRLYAALVLVRSVETAGPARSSQFASTSGHPTPPPARGARLSEPPKRGRSARHARAAFQPP